MAFVEQLEAWKSERLAPIVGAGQTSLALAASAPGDAIQLLQIALANEINVSELAAAWMPSTRELDVKIAFARQAGDEAGHFQLVADRLTALGFDVASFAPTDNPLFQYLRSLTTTVERIAAGLFTLESIAYGVNENFMAFCAQRGDVETVRIYREYIQPTLMDSTIFSLNSFRRSFSSTLRCSERYRVAFSMAMAMYPASVCSSSTSTLERKSPSSVRLTPR